MRRGKVIKHKGGLYLNIASLIASGVAGPFVAASLSLPNENDKFRKALIICVVCALSVVCYCGFAYIASSAGTKWLKPSLRYQLCLSGQPLQLFYVGSFAFLAMSLGCLIGSAWFNSSYAWILFASIGMGCLLGALLSTVLFSNKISAK